MQSPPKNDCGRDRDIHATAAIREWLISRLAERLGIEGGEIATDEPFANYGLSSREAVVLTGEIEESLHIRVSPTVVWEYPSIEQLARHLAGARSVGTIIAADRTYNEPIAIVGIGCRFPGANDPASFWRLLEEATDAVAAVPDGRPQTRGGFLHGVDQFDAQFFGIAPREAVHMDPQQRLLLEVAWEALENSGQPPPELSGSTTGVFIGISTNDYGRLQFSDPGSVDAYSATGTAFSIAANRISYFLNLKGPSLAIDTACSSSLVAVHLACQSLRSGECNLALAGGVSVILTPELTVAFSKAQMMAEDGRCKTFDASADGYVRGEGCGVVVLKRLSDAVANGDHVIATVRGSAVNQDGRSNGLTAPHGPSQQAVIRQALRNAGVTPNQISYVEAHGTGTPLGDPIEVQSLWEVLREDRDVDDLCAIGSVKTNIGHLEAAAGIAGLIKTALCLEHRRIPAHLHLRSVNRHIQLEQMGLRIPVALEEWAPQTGRRFAGVSSFGFGGTNAHVVLEEAGAVPSLSGASGGERPLHLLALSAQSEADLRQLCGRYADYLETHPDVAVPSVCFTANAGRAHFGERWAGTGADARDLAACLRTAASQPVRGNARTRSMQSRNGPKIALMYTGQGSQYSGMGRELYRTEPAFRKVLDACDDILRNEFDRPLLSVLFANRGGASRLDETEYTQPALFALECGLTELWRSWGIEPDAVLGHSAGAYAAAYAANVFSLEDGLRLTAKRGELMQSLAGRGSMAVVFAAEAQVSEGIERFRRQVSIAAVNCPQQTVISGEMEALQAVIESLHSAGIFTKLLHGSQAFHSPVVEPVLDAFEEVLQTVTFAAPKCTYISDVTGLELENGEIPAAAYWKSHAREAVQFAKGIATLLALGHDTFVEVGPAPTLLPIAKRGAPEHAAQWLASLKPGESEVATMLQSLGSLYVRGADVDWSGFHRCHSRRRVPLPTYPFERKRYWKSPSAVATADSSNTERKDLDAMSTPTENRTRIEPARKDNILDSLRHLVARLLELHVSEVDTRARLLEMGADSLVLLEAVRKIEHTYGIHLTMQQIFEDLSTLEALAGYIDRTLPAGITGMVEPTEEEKIVTPSAPAIPAESSAPASVSHNGIQSSQSGSSLERIMAQQLDLLSRVMLTQVEALRCSGHGSSIQTPQTETVAPALAKLPELSPPRGKKDTPNSEPFSPYRPIKAGPVREWNPRQREYVTTLISRFTARTQMSKRMARTGRSAHADIRNSLNFRLSTKEFCYPIVAARSEGSKIWDVDGNEYVDLTMGFGANLFGHGEPFIHQAIADQMKLGMHLGPQSELAGEVASLICGLTGMDRVTFCNSGTESVMTALRLARTATGRSRVAIFAGSYHGAWDGVLAKSHSGDDSAQSCPMAPGVTQGMIDDVLVVNYGSPRSLEILKSRAHELAAVLVEPVQSRRPDFQPEEFLHQVRAITRDAGAALIFDEVITGFRIHPGGAQAWFGIEADLATYGKVIGGGMPIGVVAGRKRYMDGVDGGCWEYGDESLPQAATTFYSGTFCKHPLAMSAARSILNRLKAAGPELQEELNRRTGEMSRTLNNFFDNELAPVRVAQFGSLFRFSWPFHLTITEVPDVFYCRLAEKGVYIWEGRNCFLSTAHTESDVDQVIRAVEETVVEMQQVGFLVPPEDSAPSSSVVRTAALTDAQKHLRILVQMGEAAHETVTLRLRGPLRLSALKRAFQAVVDRHDALRTRVPSQQDVQEILPSLTVDLPLLDFSFLDSSDRTDGIAAWLTEESCRRFDLTRAPLWRVSVLKEQDQEHLLVFTAHHIVVDGWSMGVILQEVGSLYTAECLGKPIQLPRPMQLPEYVEWELSEARTQQIAANERYWRGRFSGELPVLELPTDRPRPAVKSYRGSSESLTLYRGISRDLKQLSRKHGCTLFMTLLAAYVTLLRRTTGQDDIVIGFPVSGRSAPGSEQLVAFCSHLLALRSSLADDPSFAANLSQIKALLLEAYDHQDYPFAKLIQNLNLPADPGRSPVVSVTFNMERTISVPSMHGVTTELVSPPVSFSEFDLHLNVTEVADELIVDLVYDTELFDRVTARGLLDQFRTVLDAVVADATQSVSTLPVLTDEERRQLLHEWNDTARDYPQNSCLHELFEAQAARTPDAVALVFDDNRVTYRQLDERANQLARHLRKLGAGADTSVGIHMERSIELVVGLMGILKAGAAYLPLDPDYPNARLKFMLEDARVPVVLTQARLHDRLPDWPGAVVCVDRDWDQIRRNGTEAVIGRCAPDNLAYVIYTSGSTGQPKGAMITHRGICNRLLWMQEAYQLTESDRVLQKTPFSFDVSVWEFFWPLLNGACLVVARPGGHKDNAYLVKLITEQEITTLHFVPSMLRVFLEEPGVEGCRTLTRVICSGEALPAEVQQRFFSVSTAALHNLYGPTEASVDVTYWECMADPEARTVPIGRPIANIQTYVLDRHLNPVPAGVPGELHLAGVGLGRGYLNRPDLTASRFIPNPFGAPGQRMYKTGDLVRYLRGGEIEFLGRLDHQVKIRGFRIELQEIESLLDQHPSIRQSVVLAREDQPGVRRLVAYFVSHQDVAPDAASLRRYLSTTLPEHAIPSAFVRLDSMPLSANGKVERRALPAPVYSSSEIQGFESAPRNDVESLLSNIWAGVLKVDAVGIHDNFFELGADSIQVIQTVARANRAGLSITSRQLFENPTIAQLAAAAGGSGVPGSTVVDASVERSSVPVQVLADPRIEDSYPLSPMQRGMLYHCLSAPTSFEYLEQSSVLLQGPLDFSALQRAWTQVIARHAILRTAFVWDGLDEPSQTVYRDGHLDFEIQDLSGLRATAQQEAIAAHLRREQQRPFDLSQPSLLRLALFRLSDEEHQLVWSNHHLVLDGWSKPLVINEVRAYYEAFSADRELQLAPTRQYRDYIEWLRGADLAEAEAFWRRTLNGFRVPTGFGGCELAGAGQPNSGEAYGYEDVSLSAQTTSALGNLCRQHKLTLNTLAQGAWALLLSRYSGDADIVFGGVVSGRQVAFSGIESIVGLCINTLPVRVRVPDDMQLVPWLHGIQSDQINARQFEYSPLVEVQRWSDIPPGARLFESILVFGNRPEDSDPAWALTEWSLQRSGYPLHVEFNPGEEIGIRITYSTSSFSRATIGRMLGHLRTVLEGIADNAQQTLATVPLLPDSEMQRILVDWNATEVDFPLDRPFTILFEAQVQKTPDAVAAVFRNEQLTYHEVNACANRIAHTLVQRGVAPEVTVAVLTERSLEWLTAALSVLKAGGVYLPLDPAHPPARLRQVLEQSGSSMVLTTQPFLPVLARVLETWSDGERPEVCLIEDLSRRDQSDTNLPTRASANDLAYVIYTSGSTGLPKGAMVEHAGMVNHLCAKITDLKLGSGDVVVQTASQCFDISVWQLLAALLAGAQVHILGDQVVRDPGWLLDEVEVAGATIVEVVPSMLRAMIDELHRRRTPLPVLRWMIVTGEALPPALCSAWLSLYPRIPLVNAYGPTECSDDVAQYVIAQPPEKGAQLVPIGRPIANTKLYVLDSNLRVVPIGVLGELCAGGVCVGCGYLNDANQTAKTFVTNPFASGTFRRLYRTGDLARYRDDGNIEVIGRLDQQVKVRGYRIEPGEIETALAQHSSVREAVVAARQDASGDSFLTAYMVATQHPEPSAAELRTALEKRLPEYMVPSAYVWLPSLPLTANGKVDRRALPAPAQTRSEANGQFAPPRSGEEQLLADIWAEVLGVGRVGIHDNFFELGGNSLSASRVLARLPAELQSRLPLRRLFEAPTIARLAADLAPQPMHAMAEQSAAL